MRNYASDDGSFLFFMLFGRADTAAGSILFAADLRADCARNMSIITIAAIDSTMGTALGTTHGSWRPRFSNTACSPS